MSDDAKLQSTVARIMACEPEFGGVGDLHAEIAELRSRLAAAMTALRPFAVRIHYYDQRSSDKEDDSTGCIFLGDLRRAAAEVAAYDREAGK